MNHARRAIAVSALALSAATLGATTAAATHPAENGTLLPPPPAPDCHWAYHPGCDEIPVPEPAVEAALAPAPSDDNRAETMQAGASALGGAGVALTGMWIYRRRQAANN